jgi:hypothetical protein
MISLLRRRARKRFSRTFWITVDWEDHFDAGPRRHWPRWTGVPRWRLGSQMRNWRRRSVRPGCNNVDAALVHGGKNVVAKSTPLNVTIDDNWRFGRPRTEL